MKAARSVVNNTSALRATLMNKQNELIQVMNSVANKYTQWSLIKDQFISEIIGLSSKIDSDIFSRKISTREGIHLIEIEVDALKKQDEALSRKELQQVAIVEKVTTNRQPRRRGKDVVSVDLYIAAVGFISGGLQIVAGMTLISTAAGVTPGALLASHGMNNVIENGYYLLYRESYSGPVRFVYRGLGDIFGFDVRTTDIVYTFVDMGLSLNGLLGYKLADNTQHLYRYVNLDFLWGMKQRGMSMMNSGEIITEIWGDINTLQGQWRNY
ncbi:hypothetical protein GM30_09340 [Trabulsiella odontotermitis]|nr:hypothetical protein GM30_09340 [Trabulsiella odontotermitis]